MSGRILHQPIATAPFEPYGGPPGRLDVADVVTTANSSSIAAGLCIAEGGPLAYRVDYDAMVVALDSELVWQDAAGPQALAPGDIVWLPEGARNTYWSTGVSRFFYTTWPVNWAEIVGWEAGRDVKDLAAQGGPAGGYEGIVTRRRDDASFQPFPCEKGTMEVAAMFGPSDGVSMAAGLVRLDAAVKTRRVAHDTALVVVEGTAWFDAGDGRVEAGAGDLLWLPRDVAASYGSEGTATLAYVSWPVDWAAGVGWSGAG